MATKKQNRSSPKQSTPLDPLSQRLLEMTFAPFDEVLAWLSRLGIEVTRSDDQEGGTAILWNPSLQIRTGFMASSDPTTRAVSLGFITASAFWPHLYPGLLKAVDAEVKKRRRAAAEAVASPEETSPEETISKSEVNSEPQKEQEDDGEPISIFIGPTFQQLYREELEPAVY